MWSQVRRVIRYTTVGGLAAGSVATGVSLHDNNYDISSLGIVRLSRSALAVLDVAQTYKRTLYFREWPDKQCAEYKELKSRAHTIAANRLLELCCANKGVYIKVGQHIGALDYLLPAEYVQTMKVLHSRAPQNPVEDLYKVMRQELKRDPAELFAEFDAEPLGTASLAQVHRAVLRETGEVVAVKVQHPFVRGNSRVDMKTMELGVALMAWVFPDFKMQWLVDVTKKNLPIELDFENEGRNADKVRDMFANFSWLRVPRIHWSLSTQRVLVMDYLAGGQINDLDYIDRNQINRLEVAGKLGLLYSEMIFKHGFMHSDPHPGNLLVRRAPANSGRTGSDVILLDHGLYAELTEKFRYDYSKLWLSILNVDRDAMRQHCIELGVPREFYPLFACMLTGRTWDTVVAGVGRTRHNESEKDLLQSTSTMVLPHISEILQQVDRQMLLVLKTNDLLRSIETSLGTLDRMTSFLVMTKCCIRSVAQQDVRAAASRWARWRFQLNRMLAIFRVNVYYLWLGVCSFSLLDTIKQLM